MENLNKNQKIIIIVIAMCMLAIIGYYIMQKTKAYDTFNIDSGLEISNEFETDKQVDVDTEQTIIIHIAGEINNPGIIYLKEGSRIADAIEKAGGTKSEADLSEVNLAYTVQDGQKIYIPNINEKEDKRNTIIENNGKDIIIGGEETKTNLININKASQTELETLTGIGPSTAIKIIEYRNKNGNFKTIEDIMDVPGIGESKFEAIKIDITV